MKYCLLLLSLFSLSAFAGEGLDCDNAFSTLDINRCMQQELVEAEEALEKYLAKSLERYAGDTVSVASIEKGQAAWLQYKEQHCAAVFSTWRDGSIRTAMQLGCQLTLTQQRTLTIWEAFLTYVDNSPALLPKPKFQITSD